ncbi:MAG: hypothetical protein ACE5OZ_08245 [Candidatus Heimdallarchaeota archaeon]
MFETQKGQKVPFTVAYKRITATAEDLRVKQSLKFLVLSNKKGDEFTVSLMLKKEEIPKIADRVQPLNHNDEWTDNSAE